MFKSFEQLSGQTNMKCTHIILDVCVAITLCCVQWNQPETWSKIIKNLGVLFGTVGSYISGS